jgi:hypothetical protein
LPANANGSSSNRRKYSLNELDRDMPKQQGTEAASHQSEEFVRLLLDSTGVDIYSLPFILVSEIPG